MLRNTNESEVMGNLSDKPEIMTIRDVADALGVHERTAAGWAKAGEIPARRIGGTWFIDRETLRRFIREPGQSAADVADDTDE